MITSPEENEDIDVLDLNNPENQASYKRGVTFAQRLKKGEITDEEFARIFTLAVREGKLIDSLTGLYNKEGLKDELERAMLVSKKYNIPLTLLYLDGDEFKKINDQLGHPTGDKIIQAIGAGLKRVLKGSDIKSRLNSEHENELHTQSEVARDGGDEFVVVLLGANTTQTPAIIKRLDNSIAQEININVPEYKKEFHKDISITTGFCQYHPDIDPDYLHLIARADAEMHSKKMVKGSTR